MLLNIGHGFVSLRDFQFFVLENFLTEQFLLAPCKRKNILPFECTLCDMPWASGHVFLDNFIGPCFCPFEGPFGWFLGILSGTFNLLRVRLCVGTISTKIHPLTRPQNSTTKQYARLVKLRQLSGRHGQYISKLFKKPQTNL